MNTIVISYRRQDSRDAARMLLERLLHYFPGRVVMGLEGLLPGENLRLKAEQQMQDCRLLLVLIGPDWSHIADDRGRPRLQDRRDWVRLEIATGLQRGVPILPVLLGSTPMPDEHDLPSELHSLLDLQPQRLDDGAGRSAALTGLVEAIRRQLGEADELLALVTAPAPMPAPMPEAISVAGSAEVLPLRRADGSRVTPAPPLPARAPARSACVTQTASRYMLKARQRTSGSRWRSRPISSSV